MASHQSSNLGYWAQFLKEVGFPVCIAMILLWATVVRFPAAMEHMTDKITATMRETAAEQTKRLDVLLEEIKRGK